MTNRNPVGPNRPAYSAKALLLPNSLAEGESLENPFKPDRLKFNQRPSFA
jgi:hypothetical protein